MDRLSPLSYDSGFDSLSSPATPHKELTPAAAIPMRAAASPMVARVSDDTASLPGVRSKEQAADYSTLEKEDGEQEAAEAAEPSINTDDVHEQTIRADDSVSLCCKDNGKPQSGTSTDSCCASEITDDFNEKSSDVGCSTATCVPSTSSTEGEGSTQVVPEARCCQEPSTSLGPLVINTTVESKSAMPSFLEDAEEDELLDLAEPDYPCCWKDCRASLDSYNEMYDHVVELHIAVTRESSAGEEDDTVRCCWDSCKLSMSRGDKLKKFNWLLDHFRTRHARHADAFKCLFDDCGARFCTTGKLEDHVRQRHITTTKKAKTASAPKPEPVFGWKWRTWFPQAKPGSELMSQYYDFEILKRMCFLRDNGPQELVYRRRPGIGAKHRKMYGFYGADWVPAKKSNMEDGLTVGTTEVVEDDAPSSSITACSSGDSGDADTISASAAPMIKEEDLLDDDEIVENNTTLDDLFPGWNYEEKKAIQLAADGERRARDQSEVREHRRQTKKRKSDTKRYNKWIKTEEGAAATRAQQEYLARVGIKDTVANA